MPHILILRYEHSSKARTLFLQPESTWRPLKSERTLTSHQSEKGTPHAQNSLRSCPLCFCLVHPLTAHADAIDQLTFNFIKPGFVPADAVIDIPASPPPSYLDGLFGVCPASNCITVLGTSPTGSNYYLVNFYEESPTETFVTYAYYENLSAPSLRPELSCRSPVSPLSS